jgi:hypothetical protein
MKKKKIKSDELKKLLESHDQQLYDICKICSVSAVTAERWMKGGVPEQYMRLIKLSLGEL